MGTDETAYSVKVKDEKFKIQIKGKAIPVTGREGP
jgi:hypothetical protein